MDKLTKERLENAFEVILQFYHGIDCDDCVHGGCTPCLLRDAIDLLTEEIDFYISKKFDNETDWSDEE